MFKIWIPIMLSFILNACVVIVVEPTANMDMIPTVNEAPLDYIQPEKKED